MDFESPPVAGVTAARRMNENSISERRTDRQIFRFILTPSWFLAVVARRRQRTKECRTSNGKTASRDVDSAVDIEDNDKI